MFKIRPRRLRKNPSILSLTQENWVQAEDLIYPLFVKDGREKQEIKSMPNVFRYPLDELLGEIEDAMELGIRAIALFPVIQQEHKTLMAEESYNPSALTQKSIRAIKKRFPELILISDIALDPYTSHGHDGLIKDGKILNDETVAVLCKMALAQAEAGADIVAPSDMMDGRIGAIRSALDAQKFFDTKIMAYTAKYKSSLYAPFRDALGSLGSGDSGMIITEDIPKDKSSYQMNFANSREALRELALDIEEGADIVMVKPAGWYGDIIKLFKQNSNIPIAAYQVSGEYAMIYSAYLNGYLDLKPAINESLLSIKRAGADLILSYFAKEYLSF
jgi:porphobilinogen synthase